MTSIRVLLVEDETDIRTLLAELLRHDGYEVIEAENSDQAVALIDGPDGFDLLLTDVTMPGLVDGIQVAAYARQLYPHRAVQRWRIGRTESDLQQVRAEVKRLTREGIPELANV